MASSLNLSRDDMQEFVRNSIVEATQAADEMSLAANNDRYQRKLAAAGISESPEYSSIMPYFGKQGTAAILSVDLRKSSLRAVEVGPRDTYITIHAYLPTMAKIVHALDHGMVIGLRGDGLFAAVGLSDGTHGSIGPGDAVRESVVCARAMIEATTLINAELKASNIRLGTQGALVVSIGIDYGRIVVTRIGFRGAIELTAYGPPVNNACKMASHGNSEIRVTAAVKDRYPTSPQGKASINPIDNGIFRVEFPDSYSALT